MAFVEFRSTTLMWRKYTRTLSMNNPGAPSPMVSTDSHTRNTPASSSSNHPNAPLSSDAGRRMTIDLGNSQEFHKCVMQPRADEDITSSTSSNGERTNFRSTCVITAMVRAELQRPLYTGEKFCMYRAMSAMWDGGESVLRSIRIRAHEMNDATRDAMKEFFAPLFIFTVAYISVRLPSAVTAELEAAKDEFEQSLEKMSEIHGVISASEAGYRFRNVCLKASANVEDDFLPLLTTCLAAHPDGPVALIVLSRGYTGSMMSRRRWVARMLHPKRSTLRRMFTLPRNVRHMWRMHKRIVWQFKKELEAYIADHVSEKPGFR